MRFFPVLLLFFAPLLCGCFKVPYRGGYNGPPERPEWFIDYYDTAPGYSDVQEKILREEKRYVVKQITLQSDAGEIKIDYYQRRRNPTDDIVLVFPILGGKENLIAGYFAETFAFRGLDTAIVHRNVDFKDPKNVDRLEEIFRDTVIRDRLAIDYFESTYGKKDFGSFGISRGAINVSITAGVDPRLKYNVLALGGTKLVQLFAYSTERRLEKYRRSVRAAKKISGEEFIRLLESQIKTEPKHLAQYMDARHTLMFLSLFDSTVPIKYGRELRDQIGRPKTIYLLADHRTSALYTQFIPLFPPSHCLAIFPIDYIETEAMHFYDKSFKTKRLSPKHFVFTVLQVPFMVIESLISLF
jgi:hypothetical protein